MQIAGSVLYYVELRKRNGRKFERETLHLGLISLQLPDQVRVAIPVGTRSRLGQAGLNLIDLLGNAIKRFLETVARDRKSTRLNSSHTVISYAVFCLKKKKE